MRNWYRILKVCLKPFENHHTVFILFILLIGCTGHTTTPTAAPLSPIQSATDRISPTEAWNKIHAGALVVDVRSNEEFVAAHLREAINIPVTEVADQLAQFGPDKNREIVLYCRSGRRSGIAREILIKNGFINVYNAGGYAELSPAGS